MTFEVRFYKERMKFSAAHFTIFSDGEVERLHGHNYAVEAAFFGDRLEDGMLFPFHQVKPIVQTLCDAWDEMVLLPGGSPFTALVEKDRQVEVTLETPRVHKFYSFPREDVVVLPCNNISSENLAALFADHVAAALPPLNLKLRAFEIGVGESSGQKVIVTRELT